MKLPSKLFSALLLILAWLPSRGQDFQQAYERRALVLPESATLRADAEFLSDTLLHGRGVGTTGAVEASWYVLRRFRLAGLQVHTSSFRAGDAVGHNVVGIHNGNPKKGTYTLIMAHFDGMGERHGEILPGADANASGTAVMLYLADSLATGRGNYIFAALDAHHASMAGAEALLAELKGRYKLDLVVNLDTIGTMLAPPNPYRPDFLIALGGKPFEKALDSANTRPNLKLYFDYYRSKSFTDYFYKKASDQAPFLAAGYTCVMFTSGITMNTNKPTDTASTLDFPVTTRRAALILYWLRGR